jgi:acetyltransferase-like isoleucine patch superfamily enzyme
MGPGVRIIKIAVFCLALVAVSPLVVLAWLEKRTLRTEGVFLSGAQFVAVLPGPVGTYLRSAFYYGTLDECSWEVHIGFGSFFTHRGAKLQRHVSTGAYCVMGHARLGAGVRLASRVSIPSGRRQHFDEQGRLSAGSRFDEVSVGSGCWVGEGAIVMADVGADCVVSAGAVVVKDMPAGHLVAGNPAQAIRVVHSESRGT